MTKVAVVGCGHWGKNLIRNFHELGALAAISDSDAERAAAMSQQYEVPALPIRQILDLDVIDSLVIATPVEAHASLACLALEANKHVFVEKPMALTLEDARRIRDIAQARNLVVLVGHVLRYHPAFVRLQRIIADGLLGKIEYIYSHRLNFGKVKNKEDVFWSFAPHDISMILAVAGEEPHLVQSIGHCYLQRSRSIADIRWTHLSFRGGVNAHIFVSWLHPREQKFVVVGTESIAVFDDCEPWPQKLKLFRNKVLWTDGVPLIQKAEAESVEVEPDEPLSVECRHFIDCITQRRQPLTDVREGISVLEVLNAASEAATARSQIFLQRAPDENRTDHV